MITTKQRAALRGYGHTLEDIVFVGKEGVTEAVISQVNANLTARELIKIKVQANCDLTPREVSDELCKATKAEGVSVVGRKVVLYRYTNKKDFKHYEI